MTFPEIASRELNTLVGTYRAAEAIRRVQESGDSRDLRITLSDVFTDPPWTCVWYGNRDLSVAKDFLGAVKAATAALIGTGLAQREGASNVSTPRSFEDFIAYRKELHSHVKATPDLCAPWGTFESRSYEGVIDIAADCEGLRLIVCAHALDSEQLEYSGYTLDTVTSSARFAFERLRRHEPITKNDDPIVPLFAQAQ